MLPPTKPRSHPFRRECRTRQSTITARVGFNSFISTLDRCLSALIVWPRSAAHTPCAHTMNARVRNNIGLIAVLVEKKKRKNFKSDGQGAVGLGRARERQQCDWNAVEQKSRPDRRKNKPQKVVAVQTRSRVRSSPCNRNGYAGIVLSDQGPLPSHLGHLCYYACLLYTSPSPRDS